MTPAIITVIAFSIAAALHSTAPQPVDRMPDDGVVIGGLYVLAGIVSAIAWGGSLRW